MAEVAEWEAFVERWVVDEQVSEERLGKPVAGERRVEQWAEEAPRAQAAEEVVAAQAGSCNNCKSTRRKQAYRAQGACAALHAHHPSRADRNSRKSDCPGQQAAWVLVVASAQQQVRAEVAQQHSSASARDGEAAAAVQQVQQ